MRTFHQSASVPVLNRKLEEKYQQQKKWVSVHMHKSYGKHSTLQGSVIVNTLPYLQQALDLWDHSLPDSKRGRTLRLADYGSAMGNNSVPVVQTIVSHVLQNLPPPAAANGEGGAPARCPDILVSHVDLPGNDWPALFLGVQASEYGCGKIFQQHQQQASSKGGCPPPKLLSAAFGRSFYEVVLPEDSVDFGFSYFSAHWLSRAPTRLRNFLTASFTPEEDEQNWFRDQAKRDWSLFLENRTKELRPGGLLLVHLVTLDDQGPVQRFEELEVFGVLEEVARRAEKQNLITREERSDLTIPHYHRTKAELLIGVPEALKVESVSEVLPFSFHASLQERVELRLAQYLQRHPGATDADKKKERALILAKLGCKAVFAITQTHLENSLLKGRVGRLHGDPRHESDAIAAVIKWMKEEFVRVHVSMFSSDDEAKSIIKPRLFSSVIVFRKQEEGEHKP